MLSIFKDSCREKKQKQTMPSLEGGGERERGAVFFSLFLTFRFLSFFSSFLFLFPVLEFFLFFWLSFSPRHAQSVFMVFPLGFILCHQTHVSPVGAHIMYTPYHAHTDRDTHSKTNWSRLGRSWSNACKMVSFCSNLSLCLIGEMTLGRASHFGLAWHAFLYLAKGTWMTCLCTKAQIHKWGMTPTLGENYGLPIHYLEGEIFLAKTLFS